MIQPLSRCYAEARRAFLDAAAQADAELVSTEHPLIGLDGEPLHVDVAEVASADPSSVIVIVSGTHGVEGYLGSALQRHHLETITSTHDAPTHREGPTLVFVHALNPYGFSWVRRVNEDNVDLNRNFIDWGQPVPANDDYATIANTLVPSSWSEEEQDRTRSELLAMLTELGLERAQQIISGGQFSHPTGLFYGGTGPTWSNRWLCDFLQRRLASVDRTAVIDLHTGLGPWSHAELISSEAPGSDALARQRSWWGDVTSIAEGTSISAEITGEWLALAGALVPDTELTGIAIEYGTVDTVTILDSLRADAVLHATGNERTPAAEAIRAQVRAAFLDDDPAWLQACWPSYEATFAAAADQLGAPE